MVQLLQYNCYVRFKEGAPTNRHSKDRETLFPIYIGMSVFAKTRRKKLIEMFHANGLSISYNRVLQISAELGDAVVSKYIREGVVCPSELRRGLFTTSAMDNIDHNPSSSERSSGILFFHAFTGCDTVSAFRGKGKRSAWQTWDVCSEASDVFRG